MYVCMDGTGVPVVKAETVGRHGKGEDGIAKTREVNLTPSADCFTLHTPWYSYYIPDIRLLAYILHNIPC